MFSASGDYSGEPVLMFSGGVDTYKMDCHDMCVTLAQRMGVTVLVFDNQPGTAENPVPLNIEGDELVLGLVEEARRLGNGKVAHFGMSFGGNFSSMTGLSGAVDAAINLDGPVDESFAKDIVPKCLSRRRTSWATTWPSTATDWTNYSPQPEALSAGVAGSEGQCADARHQRR